MLAQQCCSGGAGNKPNMTMSDFSVELPKVRCVKKLARIQRSNDSSKRPPWIIKYVFKPLVIVYALYVVKNSPVCFAAPIIFNGHSRLSRQLFVQLNIFSVIPAL